MRQILHLFSFVIIASFSAACSGDTGKKIDISKANSPCDCIDQFDFYVGEMLLLLDEKKELEKQDIPMYLNKNEDIMEERYAKIYEKRDVLKDDGKSLMDHCKKFDEFSEFMENLENLGNALPDCESSIDVLSKMERIRHMAFWDKSFF